MEKWNWERWASILFTVCVGGVLLFIALRYAFPIVTPFLFAYLLSLLVRKPAQRFAQRTHLSEKACAVLLLMLLLGGTVWLLGASIQRLLLELEHLMERLLADGGLADATAKPLDYFEIITSRLGFLERLGANASLDFFRDRFNETVTRLLSGMMEALTAAIPSFVGRLIAALPSILLSVLITVIAGFYFCIDATRALNAVLAFLPLWIRKHTSAWRVKIGVFFKGYLRVYLLLLLMTFVELFIGFCVLRVEYAFLLALLIAVVDLLPVLGVGSVLIPWSLVLLLRKNYYLGFGLLILFATVTLIRQIMEPRLLGKSLGLHPLLTLFSAYAGWYLFGVVGMILGPIAAMLLKGVPALLQAEND